MRRLVLLFALSGFAGLTVLSAVSAQQTPPPTVAPPAIPSAVAPGAQTPPPGLPQGRGQTAPPVPSVPAPGRGSLPPGSIAYSKSGASDNIKVDLTFTETVGGEQPTRKSVTMLVTDGYQGRIRSQGVFGGVLNVDAVPDSRGDKVFLRLTIEYQPEPPTQQAASQSQARFGTLTQSLSVMVEGGKPTMITQSADPGSARRVTVEVTATVVK